MADAVEQESSREMPGISAIKVVLADDHQLVRAGVRALLDGLEDVEVVAEASDGDELLRLLEAVHPDVVVTDLRMPRSDGFAALRRIRERDPALKVIVLSMDGSVESIRNAIAGGANGYLRKDAPATELATALRTVMLSDSYFGTGVIQRLAAPVAPGSELLTERQLQILVLLANGKSTKEIAFELGLSTKTVDLHRRRIMDQLQVNDLASLTRYAVRNGFVEP
jgi:DNA-binding NarL/FixJ family response regulator